jgi:hypothetical protein
MSKRPHEEEEEEEQHEQKKSRSEELPYFFVAPFPISDTGLLCTSWSPSSTPEGTIIEQAIQHAIELKTTTTDDSGPDCYIGTLLCAIEMLEQKKQEEKSRRKLLALCKKHWPALLEVKDFGEWKSDEELNFLTAHVVLYYAEDPF